MSAWYVGIDPASSLAGFAAISDSGELLTLPIECAARGRRDLPGRLRHLRHAVHSAVANLNDQGIWCVAVERPITAHGGASLLAAYGVAVEAAASATPAAILTLMPAEVDRAAHTAVVAAQHRKARSMAFARELGYDGDSQDVADAVVAAAAGRTLTRRAVA